jgi:CheY-like chemotaxis protein
MTESLYLPLLLVEDSEEDVDTLREAMHVAGLPHPIVQVNSGSECLALLRGETPGEHRRKLRPALILLDLNSHGIDGRDALATMKSDPVLREIPIVVLTTSANPRDVDFCYRAGVNAYHVKPVRHDSYQLQLGTLLNYWLRAVALPPDGGIG